MKKILFIASALAIVAGCAKVTTVDTAEPQEIAVEAYTNVSTKLPITDAVFPTNWNMLVHALYDGDADNLYYFGEGGTSFTYDGSSVWHDATTTRYWPATGTLTFNAVAPTATTIGGVTPFTGVTFNYGSGYDLSNITATLADNSSNQTDVLVAKTVKSGKTQGGLPMTFKHALAQVVFMAATVDASRQTITIKKAVLKGSFQEGSMTAKPSESDVTFVWSTEGKTAKDMNVCESANQQLTTTATEVGKPVLVVPKEALDDTQLLELTYDITYPYPDEEASMTDVVATVALKVDGEKPATSWDAGKKYIYTLTFSGPQEITIDPSVGSWVDQEVEVPGL